MEKKLTKLQEEKLKSVLRGIIRESLFENGFFEAKEKEPETDDENGKEGNTQMRKMVKTWLDSALELHSVLAYRLWPEKKKSTARASFSKKYNGEDSYGNEYSFSDSEITRLYNMRNDYVKRSDLTKKAES